MGRVCLAALLLVASCATPPVGTTTTSELSSDPTTTAVLAASTASTVAVTTTTTQALQTAPTGVGSRGSGDAFPSCEPLPTAFEVVEVAIDPEGNMIDPVTGEPVRIFDLAETAGVATYRFRSDTPVPLLGEYRDGITRYVMDDPTDWGAEWLVEGTKTLILGDDGWFSPFEITITPWLWSEPSIIYMFSMLALPESSFDRWDVADGIDVGVFVGGPEAVGVLEGKEPEIGGSVDIWMSPDCYPVRFFLLEGGAQVQHWELFDVGAEVDFELPPEWSD